MRRLRLRQEAGQVLVMVAVALPMIFSFLALVVDGSSLMVHKRENQNAADAVALAIARDIDAVGHTCAGCNDDGLDYLHGNKVDVDSLDPAWHACADSDPSDPTDVNCYAYPYVKRSDPGTQHWNKVEVRVQTSAAGFFTSMVGLADKFKVTARAVASATPETETVCDNSNPVASPPSPCVIPGADAVQGTYQPAGDDHCTFNPPVDNPDQYLNTTPPCTIPAGDPTHGEVVPAQDAHCTFDPPVANPDQYLPNCVIPGTDPIQGTFVAAQSAHCIFDPPVDNPDQYLANGCVIPGTPAVTGTYHAAGSASCEFTPPVANPDQYLTTNPPCTGPVTGGVDGAMAFAMSRECDALSYSGAGGGTVGSLVTNGGIWFQGNAPKKVARLGYDQPGCPDHPARPPSGTSACTDTSNNLCAKLIVDLSDRTPIYWPVPPPQAPSPLPSGTTWDPSTHYPSSCIDLGTSDRSFAPGNGPPGVYCLRGGATLTLGGNFTSGDGYTFFALGGGKIGISSNGTKIKFYWPSSCGARPAGRPASFACFGRTISGYDPQTLLYATNTVHDAITCDKNAICISGQNSNVDGDMFAVAPAVFPPPDRSP